MAENEAATRAAEMQTGMVPQASPVRAPRPLSFGAPAQPVPASSASPQFLAEDAPMPNSRVPMPPVRPNFGLVPGVTAQADMPTADAVPTAGTMPAPTAQPAAPDAPGFSLGGFFQKLGESGVSDQLIGIGTGLMTTKGFGPGLAAGFQNAQKASAQRAVSDLARAELEMKTGKVRRETEANNSTRASLIRAGHAPEKVDLAISASGAGHSEALNNLLKTAVPAPQEVPFGWVKQADGSYAPAVGGPQDPNTLRQQKMAGELTPQQIEEKAAAQTRGTNSATPDADFTLGPGQERRSADGRVIAKADPSKAEGFDMEKTLRSDFNKNLGSFQDVHDGYGRVLAATKLRETDPGKVTPASDMSLVFGFMKMLDPTSVVREGEYATAKNATGIPDQIANMYNKALKGEFLTMAQREDLVRQSQELYNTARGNAEGLSNQYRGIAGRYGVNPDNVIALPAVPAPRNFGNTGGGASPSPAAAPDRSAIEAEMRRRGLR
ncbi:hypothetical protein [Methylobacterium sp. CM6247]